MNKKILLMSLFLFLLLLLSNAHAVSNEISNPKAGGTFNVGTSVVINGQITLSSSVSGAKVSFYAYSRMLNKTITLTTKYYSFTKDVTVTFSQINKGTIIWIIPSDIETSSDWKILVRVTKDTTEYKAIDSGEFSVSKSLSITISSNQNSFNFGETLEISGTILDAQGKPIEGDATISLEEKTLGTIVTDSATITNGYLSYSYTFKSSDPPGLYTFAVKLQDNNGNTGMSIIPNIAVSNAIKITCDTKTPEILPGSEFIVTGTAKNVHNAVLGNLKLNAFFLTSDNTTLTYDSVSDANGNFAFESIIPSLISPGVYGFRIYSSDSKGNEGSCIVHFTILSSKKIIASLNIDKAWYYQDDKLLYSTELKSSSNLDVSGTLDFYVDGKKIRTSTFTVSKGLSEVLNEIWEVSAEPGNHTIRVVVSSGNEVLFETPPKTFSVYAKPSPQQKFRLSIIQALVIVVVAILILIYFIFKPIIKDYLWHKEFRSSFKPMR